MNMAKIAFDQICEHKTDNGELVCAVAHTWEMLAKLKRDYYATYHNVEARSIAHLVDLGDRAGADRSGT